MYGEIVALGRAVIRMFWFPPVSIILPILHTHLHLTTSFFRTSQLSLGTFKPVSFFMDIWKQWAEKQSYAVSRFKGLASHRGDPILISTQSMWEFWKVCHRDKFVFLLSFISNVLYSFTLRLFLSEVPVVETS
jgi:hypothetical protein